MDFLDAFSHLYKRVCPTVRPSVRPSVCRLVRVEFLGNGLNLYISIGNMKLCHLQDNSETSTRADRQNASVVRTLFDLFMNDMILVRKLTKVQCLFNEIRQIDWKKMAQRGSHEDIHLSKQPITNNASHICLPEISYLHSPKSISSISWKHYKFGLLEEAQVCFMTNDCCSCSIPSPSN